MSTSTSAGPSSAIEVTRVLADRLSPAELDEWRRLEGAAPVSVNPFLTPEWVLPWYQCYTAPAERVVLLVRLRKTGELIGLAPLHRQQLRVGPLRVARRLVPVGASQFTALELPGHLAAPGQHREVMRAVVGATLDDDADWGGASIAPEQGWFEPEHVMVPTRRSTSDSVDFWQHVRSRACVVLRLGATWEETQAGFKRNLKESLRRSRNRLEKSGLPYAVHHRTGSEVDEKVVDRFIELHRDRAENPAAGVSHPDSYSDPTSRRLLTLALPTLAQQGRASIFELELDGEVVACQLALHGPGSSYVHSSGFRSEAWPYGPVTHLVGALVRAAVARGDRVVNFSPGPRVSKLRWSEECWVSNEFAFGVGPRSMLRRYTLLRGAAAMRPSMAGIEWNARSQDLVPVGR
jgi:CelD/BcsL family acetyltransferase involved in cellulose biosynthesis